MLCQNLLDVAGGQGSSSLPNALVLATHTDQIFTLHVFDLYYLHIWVKCRESFIAIVRISSRAWMVE